MAERILSVEAEKLSLKEICIFIGVMTGAFLTVIVLIAAISMGLPPS